MCCLILVASGLGPRIAIVIWWIFGEKVDMAFGSFIWPLLGVVFVPWTTLFYVITWAAYGDVTGPQWLIVALGIPIDIATYSARAAKARYGT